MVSNMSTITLSKAKKRWRLAYFSIYFISTMKSTVEVSKKVNSYPKSLWDLVSLPFYKLGINMISVVSIPQFISNPLYQTYIILYHVPDLFPKSPIKLHHLNLLPQATNPNHHSTQFSSIDQANLTNLVKSKDVKMLQMLNGVTGLAESLHTTLESGIMSDDIENQKIAFGSNIYKKPPPKGFIRFVMEAFKDISMLILLACATLSLGFGMKENGAKEGWYKGGSIFVAVFLVITVSAVSDFRLERLLERLSKISNNIKINAIRDGRRHNISIFDVVVGDVIILNIGDQVPADGLFIDGHSLLIDESGISGESDLLEIDAITNPFLFSGSKVADGHGKMLVISVGMNTVWGEMMSSITDDFSEQTPLQSRLNKLASSVGMVGLAVAILVLAVMLIRYFTGHTKDENGNREYDGKHTNTYEILNSVTSFFAMAVAILVVAVPEGLPLAVPLTLAYSMKRMMADKAMVRRFSACEAMASATAICTNKTGTLTINCMTVTKFWLGLDLIEDSCRDVDSKVRELYHQGVGLNTTGSVYNSGTTHEYSGSPTEKAILSWAVNNLGMDMEILKQGSTILHVETFNSEKKRSGVSIKKNDDDTIHVHWKGAAEMVLSMCSNYYQKNGLIKSIGQEEKTQFENIIQGMAASSLRCIAFAHSEDRTAYKTLNGEGLTLLGIVGIKDPCRPGVKEAIETCRSAGVEIKMITGDNIFTAKATATELGILKFGQQANKGEVVEGEEFRNYTEDERMERVDHIRVMARSSPFDKLLMVQSLRKKGHVVAVTGNGRNDAPALHEADVGLSMGIQGSEVAKESSDIVILDDDFASVAVALRWGRCVYNNIQKFIQFQLTVNGAALVINFVAAVFDGEVPLTVAQLLWVNLIMNTLGALALATERPTKELMHKPPIDRVEPLITNVMWRNLLAQSLYQITILLTFQFRGKLIFSVDERVKNTIIFNTFVLCQVFSELNSRKLEKRNVFEGLHKNRLFMGIVGTTIVLQVVMVEFLKNFANTEKLNGKQWGICIGFAALSGPLGMLVKLIPVPERPFSSYIEEWV